MVPSSRILNPRYVRHHHQVLQVTHTAQGMGEVVQLQGDQRTKIRRFFFFLRPAVLLLSPSGKPHTDLLGDFLTDKENGLGLDGNTIKVHGF